VPWLRRLVAGLSTRRSGFDPGFVHVGFVVYKVALGQVFPPESFGFPLPISFHRCSITRKNEKTLIIFISGLHNKPQGCGASVASAAGPFTTHKKKTVWYLKYPYSILRSTSKVAWTNRRFKVCVYHWYTACPKKRFTETVPTLHGNTTSESVLRRCEMHIEHDGQQTDQLCSSSLSLSACAVL
jgi:hypothetical protein